MDKNLTALELLDIVMHDQFDPDQLEAGLSLHTRVFVNTGNEDTSGYLYYGGDSVKIVPDAVKRLKALIDKDPRMYKAIEHTFIRPYDMDREVIAVVLANVVAYWQTVEVHDVDLYVEVEALILMLGLLIKLIDLYPAGELVIKNEAGELV